MHRQTYEQIIAKLSNLTYYLRKNQEKCNFVNRHVTSFAYRLTEALALITKLPSSFLIPLAHIAFSTYKNYYPSFLNKVKFS